MSQSAIIRSISEICKITNDRFLNKYIKFASTHEEIENVKRGVYEKHNFAGTVGVIDCTHVAIVLPPQNDADTPALLFLNRKNFHSINVQIICDSELNIVNITLTSFMILSYGARQMSNLC